MSLLTRAWGDAAPRARRRGALADDRRAGLGDQRATGPGRDVTEERRRAREDRRAAPEVLLVCSSGGHLAQLVTLAPELVESRRRWVTFPTRDARSLLALEDMIPAYHPTTRSVKNLLRNLALARRTFEERRPDVVISSGAAVAFPFFLLARVMGIPTVYVEVYDRLDGPTLTGRLCRPLSTRMLVQWEEQLEFYPGATVVGPLL